MDEDGALRYNVRVAFKKSRQPVKALPLEELMNYAGRVLTIRAQTTSELREKLKRRAAVPTDAEEVIRRLKEGGILNDQRFAESFAGWRRDNEGFGKTRVVRDLLARKVAPEVAKQATEKQYAAADEVAMIGQYLARKYRTRSLADLLASNNPGRAKNLTAAYRKLRGAGFSTGNSIKVLKRYAVEAERLEEMEEAPSEE